MEINLDLLSIQNPWWQGSKLKFDPLVRLYHENPIDFVNEQIENFNLNKDIIYSIRGARGLGKSTIIKTLINKLIENKKIDPKQIFYYSCQNIDTYEQLNELIKLYLSWQGAKKNKRAYIFIDEITPIKNWAKGIEYLASAGKLKNITMFLVGSTLYNKENKVKRNKISQLEFSVKTENIILTELSFVDFIKILNPKVLDNIPKNLSLVKNFNFLNNLEYYLDVYCLTGGLIFGIGDYKKSGVVNQSVYSNYLHWLNGDLSKIGRDTTLLRQIMERVILNLGEPLGYKTIAKKTKAKTHLTVEDYLNILESMLVIKLVYQGDKTGQIQTAKSKKVYFRDPFLFWLFYSYIYGATDYWNFSRQRLHETNVYSALIKNVVYSQLIKDEKIEDWDKRVMFWRDNVGKKEIDFLVNSNKRVTPILIRYNEDIKDKDYKTIFQAGFKEGVIISKDTLNLKDKIKIIPLVYFLIYYKKLI